MFQPLPFIHGRHVDCTEARRFAQGHRVNHVRFQIASHSRYLSSMGQPDVDGEFPPQSDLRKANLPCDAMRDDTIPYLLLPSRALQAG